MPEDFSQLTDAGDCATAIPRSEERGLLLEHYTALLNFMTGRASYFYNGKENGSSYIVYWVIFR